MPSIETILSDFANIHFVFGHLSYLLMVISMLSTNMVWLRNIAIVSGLTDIFYRTVIIYDPVSIVWEAILVLVNVVQLAIIFWENRPPPMSGEETQFLEGIGGVLPASAARVLLRTGEWRDFEPGMRLATQGEPLNALLFIATGAVSIEAGGKAVARCGPGDFVGEMTFGHGGAATATVIAISPVRALFFERSTLLAAMRRRPILDFAVNAALSRNLVAKLERHTRGDQHGLPA